MICNLINQSANIATYAIPNVIKDRVYDLVVNTSISSKLIFSISTAAPLLFISYLSPNETASNVFLVLGGVCFQIIPYAWNFMIFKWAVGEPSSLQVLSNLKSGFCDALSTRVLEAALRHFVWMATIISAGSFLKIAEKGNRSLMTRVALYPLSIITLASGVYRFYSSLIWLHRNGAILNSQDSWHPPLVMPGNYKNSSLTPIEKPIFSIPQIAEKVVSAAKTSTPNTTPTSASLLPIIGGIVAAGLIGYGAFKLYQKYKIDQTDPLAVKPTTEVDPDLAEIRGAVESYNNTNRYFVTRYALGSLGFAKASFFNLLRSIKYIALSILSIPLLPVERGRAYFKTNAIRVFPSLGQSLVSLGGIPLPVLASRVYSQ